MLQRRSMTQDEFEEISLAQIEERAPTPAEHVDLEAAPLSIATLPHRRRTGLIAGLCVLATALLGIGIAGYFLYPRQLGVSLDDNTRVYNVAVQSSQLTFDVQRSVLIANPNVFRIFVDSANATLTRLGTEIGMANATSLIFEPHSNTSVAFTMHITLPYTIMPDILKTCGVIPGTTMQPLNATYDVTIDIKALRYIINMPARQGIVDLPCPPSVQSTFLSVAPQLPSEISHLIGGLI